MEIVKICKYHGDLTKEQVIYPKKRCKECKRSSGRKNYYKNQEKILNQLKQKTRNMNTMRFSPIDSIKTCISCKEKFYTRLNDIIFCKKCRYQI